MIDERNSRLQETAHSTFNLREAYISDMADYVARLRDEALFSTWGVKVLIRIPVDDWGEAQDNLVDEYSNFINTQWEDTTELVIPLFKEYRENQSVEGMTADSSTDNLWPLQVLLPTKLHLPRNSRIIFSEYNSREEKIAREWMVLGTQMKQLSDSKTYSRVANCVPARQTTYDSLNSTYLGTIWFDYLLREFTKQSLRAHGIIWFHDRCVALGGISKKYIIDEIQEVPADQYQYFEIINTYMQYLNSPDYIHSTSTGFNVGDIVPLYFDESGTRIPVMIAIDENGTLEQMSLKVCAIDELGKITKYTLLPNAGYSKLNEEEVLEVVGILDNKYISLDLVAVQFGPKELQEVLSQDEIPEKFKHIEPYCMESKFLAKKVAVSVLNW